MLSREDLKLDIAVADIDQGRFGVAILNFNVPHPIVAAVDPAEYDRVLTSICNFLEEHFTRDNRRVTFQVTATYTLRNLVTGDERMWTGSFNPGNSVENRSYLSGPLFQEFQRNTFLQEAKRCTTEDHISQCLDWTDTETEWVFSQLTSVIFSFQTRLPRHHAFFTRFNLLRGTQGQFSRVRTVPYPW